MANLKEIKIRIGSVEILAKNREFSELNRLLKFVLENHFGHLKEKSGVGDSREEWILAMYAEIVDETAKMVAKWMAIGFTHGVLNTDNLSGATLENIWKGR